MSTVASAEFFQHDEMTFPELESKYLVMGGRLLLIETR